MVQQTTTRDELSRTAALEIASLSQMLDKRADDWPDHVKQACNELITLYREFDALAQRADAALNDVMELESKTNRFYQQTQWKGDALPLYLRDLAEIIRQDAA